MSFSIGFRIFFYGLLPTRTCYVRADSWSQTEDEKRLIHDQIQQLDQKMYTHTRKFLQAEADEHREQNKAKHGSWYNVYTQMAEEREAQDAQIAAKEFTDAYQEREQATKLLTKEEGPESSSRTEGWPFITCVVAISLIWSYAGSVRRKSSSNIKCDLEAFKEGLLDPLQEEIVYRTVIHPEHAHSAERLASCSNVVDGDPASYKDEPPTYDEGSEIHSVQASGDREGIEESFPDFSQEPLADQTVQPSASKSDSLDNDLAARIQSAVENLANQEKDDEAAKSRPQSETLSEPQPEPDSSVRGENFSLTTTRTSTSSALPRQSRTKSRTSSVGSEDSEEFKMSYERSFGNHTNLPSETSELCTTDNVIANFSLWCDSNFGDDLRVVGNVPALGEWNPKRAPSMRCIDGHIWSAKVELEFPPDHKWTAIDKPLEYKYVWMSGGQKPMWEPCENRVLCQPSSGSSLILRNVWGTS